MNTRGAVLPGAGLLLASTLALAAGARAQGEFGHSASGVLDITQAAASMENRIGAVVDRELTFTDDRGYPFHLKQLFPGDRPVILVLGYYSCPDMCGTVMERMLDALNQTELVPGKDYEIVNVSIDPRETPQRAKERKERFLPKLHQVGGPEGWRFLVGDQPSIKALADSVGFHFMWLEHSNRFDHPGALLFLTPQGKLNRVITGPPFDSDTVHLAIVEAGAGKNASFWDKVRLSCLTFDSRTNVYSLAAMTVMRVGGSITLVAVAAMIFLMVRRERRRAAAPATT
jgi:protein SCO1/2